jgi:hypothetical protein
VARYIAFEQDGKTEVHAVGVCGNYATLCAIDGNDSTVGQKPAPLQIGARINCPQCRGIILAAKDYRPGRDFA